MFEFEQYSWDDTASAVLSNGFVQFICVAILTYIAVVIVKRSVRSFFEKTSFIEERKEKTLESMINSTIHYTASLGLIIFALTILGLDIGSVLAGAGVLGIILGFGAQSIIRDLLAGIFFLYEKQLHKGDFVSINDKFFGTVEDIGLRFLKLREWSGKLLTISNGSVNSIENYNIDHMRVIEKVTVSFSEDPKKIYKLLEEACEQLNDELAHYLKTDPADQPVEPFQLYGMTSLNNEHRGYEYTVTGLTEDLVYWTASKETRRIIAEKMFENGVQLSIQHLNFPQSATPHEE